MSFIRLALAQINPHVGDLAANKKIILEQIELARNNNVDVIAFPELAITGYPPNDLLFDPDFINDSREVLEDIVTHSSGLCVVIGFPEKIKEGDLLSNSAAIIADGELLDVYRKCLLPNYGIFDEKRYFSPGDSFSTYSIRETNVAINICEDIWYPEGPLKAQSMAGADLIININASPFHQDKRSERLAMLKERAVENGVTICYVNMTGGQDELVFDGNSLVVDQNGRLIAEAAQFQEDLILLDMDIKSSASTNNLSNEGSKQKEVAFSHNGTILVNDERGSNTKNQIIARNPYIPNSELEEIYNALVMGTRDYVRKNNFSTVLLGLSGGIDSALTATIAAEALGPSNVICVNMPSSISSQHSVTDSQIMVNNLGVRFESFPISGIVDSYVNAMPLTLALDRPNVAHENIQARVRGNILMALANKNNWLVLATGNKSEYATGYATLYGDMSGGLAVIKDLSKTLVYQISRYYNDKMNKLIIPESILDKEPSAELRLDQFDIDSLPPYQILDKILKYYIELHYSVGQIIDEGFERETVENIISLINKSEYKRSQAPVGIKITKVAFGKDRRYPIVNGFSHA